jgi:hypothetical protein
MSDISDQTRRAVANELRKHNGNDFDGFCATMAEFFGELFVDETNNLLADLIDRSIDNEVA